jgi:hypothetical protein
VLGGTATGTAAGGLVTLQGGAAAATAASTGGGVTVAGANGSATGAGGNGGNVQITGGNGLGTGPTNGGNITLTAGSAVGAGTVGIVLVKNVANSATAFQVQNAAGNNVLAVNTSAPNVVLGNNVANAGTLLFNDGTTNSRALTLNVPGLTASYTITLPTGAGATGNCIKAGTVSGSTVPLIFGSCGGGVAIPRVSLVPEYPGTTLMADGSNNLGTMTSDFCSGSSLLNIPTSGNLCSTTQEHNYYKWVSTSGTNDYDLYVRYKLPSDFSSLITTPIYMYAYRTNSSDSVTLEMLKGATACASGGATAVATGTAVWTEVALAANTSCTFAAEDFVIFRIHLVSSGSSNPVAAGEIRMDYNAN